MPFLLQIVAVLQVTLKRMWAQAGITLAAAFGLTMAVALIMTVPLYADAVNFRILEEQLSDATDNSRPPWTYMYTYVGAWHGLIDLQELGEIESYIQDGVSRTIGLPLDFAVRHVETDIFKLFPTDTATYASSDAVTFASFATTTDFENNINILEGAFPVAASGASGPVQVLITAELADEIGWQVGEQYLALNQKNEEQELFTIEVAGVWQAINEEDPFWFYFPSAFNDTFVVAEDDYVNIIARVVDKEVELALWYLVMDGSRVGTNQVDRLITGAARVEQQVDTLLPGTMSFIAPTDELQVYRQSVADLAVLLYTFDVAPLWLVLSFIGLVVGLAVSQQRNEIAVMRSRGGTPAQVITMAALEGLILGVISFVLGTFLALGFTQLIGRSRSFLDFSSATPVRVGLTEQGIYAGVLAVVLALIIRIVPVIAASRHTIITFKQEQARSLATPWWQRSGLDLILLAVVGYGFYVLRQQGSIVIAQEEGAANPFQNPLLLLLPALAIYALTLLFLRILPWFMNGVSWLLIRTKNVSLLQAVRYLARTPHHYRPPLSLLVLTMGLAVYTASLARTVDLQLYDDAFYEIGAEMNMVTLPIPPAFGGGGAAEDEPFTFLPVNEYETMTDIDRATRVGTYTLRAQVDGQRINGSLMGVDQDSFRDVAYWRWDFSRYRLGTLMNALGDHADGILVPESLLSTTSLSVGDRMRYTAIVEGSDVEFEGLIVGSFNYFPTWYPEEDDLLVVGNLNTVFERAGGEVLYRVWAELAGTIDEPVFRDELYARRLFNTSWRESRPIVTRVQADPARQGLFGILSVGFIASALLTVFGFFLYTLFSFRRRSVEMGVLRAVGISRGTMNRIVAWELILLLTSGLVMGTISGSVVSQQFIPFLEVSGEATDLAPPYLVEIAWGAAAQIYVLFGLLFLVALAVLSWRLATMKVFESIKLGETV